MQNCAAVSLCIFLTVSYLATNQNHFQTKDKEKYTCIHESVHVCVYISAYIHFMSVTEI